MHKKALEPRVLVVWVQEANEGPLVQVVQEMVVTAGCFVEGVDEEVQVERGKGKDSYVAGI
jgi:hypothetical protein